MFNRVLFAAALLAGACAPRVSQAETFNICASFIDSLPAVIDKQGVHCLRRDLSTSQSSGAAITVKAQNVTIDCNGYKVGGLLAGAGTLATGIRSYSALSNATIRNCNIRGFRTGIELRGEGLLVENNNLNMNTYRGIWVLGSGLIRNNRVVDTGIDITTDAIGIAGNGAVDVDGNLVDGLIGTKVGGIEVANGYGVHIDNNIVRNIVAHAQGLVVAIRVGATKNFVEKNDVSMLGFIQNSLGIHCGTSTGFLRDASTKSNVVFGFASGFKGCYETGNAEY